MKKEISSLTLQEIEEFIIYNKEPKFRAKQIYKWLNEKLVEDFEQMTNIPKTLLDKLKDEFFISKAEIIDKLVSKEDKGTIKYLFNINEDNIIESVFMKHGYGNSVCVSTQAGCRMGCEFCASTKNGLSRNLSAGEILWQIYKIQKDVDERISNIVLMGSGEPLDNFDNVMDFIKIINSEEGLNIGERHITLSTCGLVKEIDKLAEMKMQITLAVSLHAPNDRIRTTMMPIAKKYPIEQLISSCKNYAKITGRRITYEYSMIDGVNDSRNNALELAHRLRHTLCHVNLIPINQVEGNDFKKSNDNNIKQFAEILQDKGIETTIRRRLGSDINASCGQLRNEKMAES